MKQQQSSLFALVLAFAFFLLPVRGWAQVQSVQGSVTDASNGEPIPGAYVIVRGTDNSAATDQNGHYVLSLKGEDNPVLVFSCIGYKTQEVSIGKRGIVDVSLSLDSEFLNEVVVIGYGTLDKKGLNDKLPCIIVCGENRIRVNLCINNYPYEHNNTRATEQDT